MTSVVIFTRGVPGSGKTTAAVAWVAEDPDNRVRLNRDDMRYSMFGKYSGLTYEQERIITNAQVAVTKDAVKRGKDVLIDATNLNNSLLKKTWYKHGFKIAFWDFPVTLDVALERNANRDRQVPESVIRIMFKRGTVNVEGKLIDPPTPPEPVTFTPYVADMTKPDAIVVDVDGTLARIVTDRSPYDGSRAHEDEPIGHVVAAVRAAYFTGGKSVVVLSGRKDEHREVTERWLFEHGIPFDALHMRATDDNRRDDVVKHELFYKHIAPHYRVRAVYDDRLQVCRMWNAIGVPLFRLGIPDEDDF